jgi:hypothetical protein
LALPIAFEPRLVLALVAPPAIGLCVHVIAVSRHREDAVASTGR